MFNHCKNLKGLHSYIKYSFQSNFAFIQLVSSAELIHSYSSDKCYSSANHCLFYESCSSSEYLSTLEKKYPIEVSSIWKWYGDSVKIQYKIKSFKIQYKRKSIKFLLRFYVDPYKMFFTD